MENTRTCVVFRSPYNSIALVNPRSGNENTMVELHAFEAAMNKVRDGKMTTGQMIDTMVEITGAEGHIGLIATRRS